MAAGISVLRLWVVLLLGFSLLASSFNAIPVSRTGNLMDESSLGVRKLVSAKTNLEIVDESSVAGRMNLEVNDYPGSGANNRHTPRHD